MADEFQIKFSFNGPNKTYYPGQMVSGNIEFQLREKQYFSAIFVQYIGEAKVQWDEKYDSYSDREEYLNFTQPIVGGREHNADVLLPGPHKYPFEYKIPFICPSSYRGCKGKVWYRVIAHAEVPGQKIKTFEEEFRVISMLDLNGDPAIKRPINLEFEEIFSCCCWDSSPVNIRVHLPTSGYCPGQTMPVQVSVENNSDTEVNKIVFKLISKETYCARQPDRTTCTEPEEVLVKVKSGPVLSKTKKEFRVDVIVPDMIVPNLNNCSIIELNYYFKVIIKVTGCNDDEDESEIALGSIPFIDCENYEHPLKDQLPECPMPILTLVSTDQATPIINEAYTQHAPMIPYPQVPYSPNQLPYPMVHNDQYPHPVQAPYPTLQGLYPSIQQNSYNAAQPQINWQFNSNAGPQVGYAVEPTCPSAPPQ